MMLLKDVSVDRPKRWDVPFGAEMTSDDVQRLLRIEPFCKMDASRFSSSHSLHDILLNDARIAQYRAGDIVIREGEFGESAFLILRGTARVVLQSLPSSLLGRSDRPRKGWLQSLIDQVWQPRFPEVRATLGTSSSPSLGTRDSGAGTRVFLQDVPGVLDQFGTLQLTAGSFFGELGAIARAPRSATVFVEEDAALLEIRWWDWDPTKITHNITAISRYGHTHDAFSKIATTNWHILRRKGHPFGL